MIVGIDLGTTNSLAAVWRGDAAEMVPNALGELLTPSVVGLDDQGRILVGQAAKERLHTHPHLTTSLFKRYMGSATEVRLGDRSFRPEELSALVLKSLKEDIERTYGQTVTDAVISVPAYFSDGQRKATRIAGELAGLNVDKLINEPTAAALAYGTFDVSIIELFDGVMEVRASAGDNFLGGEDFDTLLLEHFVDSQRNATGFPPTSTVLQALRREAERVRKALGQDDSAEFALRVDGQQWVKTITQQELAKLYTPLLERLRAPIERALRDARIRVGDLDEILLVGGTTRMPLVRKLAAGLFGRFPSISLDPDQVVAHGAAIQAALKARSAALEEVVLTDVCPYTLGIETSNQYGGHIESGHYLPLIERNSSVPVSRVKSVVTLHDDQTRVLLKIYQGESRLVKDNIELGQLDIPVPKRKAGEVSLDVRFTYDNNGLLEAQVNIPLTGEQHSLVIENNPGVLNPQEIQQRLQALAQLKVHPRDQQVNTVLVARLERLYQENLGELREQLGHWAAQFQQVLDTQDERRIREARSELTRQLEQLDNGFWR